MLPSSQGTTKTKETSSSVYFSIEDTEHCHRFPCAFSSSPGRSGLRALCVREFRHCILDSLQLNKENLVILDDANMMSISLRIGTAAAAA